MSTLFSYFWGYFETNHFTLLLFLFLLFLSFLKYARVPAFFSAGSSLFFIVALGLALRVAWIFYASYAPQTQWGPNIRIESDVANVHAVELSQKGVWFHDAEGRPSGRRPIGYPVFLAVLYKCFGVHAEVAWAANLFLYALTACLLYGIARRTFSERAAILASLFFAVYPVSVYSVKLLTDEHLFLPLWYGGLYLLLKEVRGRFSWRAVWAYGLLFGYATMTRTHSIFMPFVVALACRLARHSWKRVFLSFFGVLVVMQLVNLPWVIRNYKAWGVPVLYTATSGYIYHSFNPYATPEGGAHTLVRGEPGFSEEVEKAELSGDPGKQHTACAREIPRQILRQPLWFMDFGTKRLLVFMGWNRAGIWPLWFLYMEGVYDPARPIPQGLKDFLEETAYAFYYVLFFSFVFGLALTGKNWRPMPAESRDCFLILAVCILFWWGEQMIIFPDRKYRFPLEPLMMLPAAYFWECVLFHFRYENVFSKRRSRVA